MKKCIKKLVTALDKGTGVTLILRCNRTKESITNSTLLPLTPRQLRDVRAKHGKQKDAKIRITTAQVKFLKSKEGRVY